MGFQLTWLDWCVGVLAVGGSILFGWYMSRKAEAALRAAGLLPERVAGDGTAAFVELREPRAIEAPDEIARLLVAAGVPPTHLVLARESLEDHFIRLTGGEVNAA
jgi:hypothetical protein